MAHVAKYTAAAVGHLCNHYGRSEDMEKSAYVIRGNENIDPSRTHLNYDLAPHREGSQLDRLHQRLSEVKVQKRADVNVLCDWVVTAPKDLPSTEHKKFFEESYAFLTQRYGAENVVSSYVHMDETTPHMHFAFVPVKHVLKGGKEYDKVSAKEVITRRDLQTFHTDLDAHLERTMGHEVHVLNGATKNGNRSIAELRRESATERLKEVDVKVAKIVSDAQNEARGIQDSLIPLRAEFAAKKAYIRECDKSSEATALYPHGAKQKKSLFGKETVTVSKELWEQRYISVREKDSLRAATVELEHKLAEFQRTTSAANLNSIKKQCEDLQRQLFELRNENRKLKSDLSIANKEADGMIDKINRVLEKLPENVAEEFVRQWHAADRGQQHGMGR